MKVAYVDDCKKDSMIVAEYIRKFNAQQNIQVELICFSDGFELLEGYNFSYDILILDVDMPILNGIELARRVRKQDPYVVILFLTNMMQSAVDGYSVCATDYILKPVSYFEFQMKLVRALGFVDQNREDVLTIKTADKLLCVKIKDIRYIETIGNRSIYHTVNGDYELRSTLKEIENKLKGHDFYRMNYSYLVNMRHVSEIIGSSANVAGDMLLISRNRKKGFCAAQLRYWAGERNFI